MVVTDDGFVITGIGGGPLTKLQAPVPVRGVLAVSAAEVARHKFWSGPAFAGVRLPVMTTVSNELLTQVPLVIVHLKTWVPDIIPVMVVVGEVGVVIVGIFGPLNLVHKPVPIKGVFAAIVAEVPHML